MGTGEKRLGLGIGEGRAMRGRGGRQDLIRYLESIAANK